MGGVGYDAWMRRSNSLASVTLDRQSWTSMFAPSSLARSPDSTGDFAPDESPTPGAPNDN